MDRGLYSSPFPALNIINIIVILLDIGSNVYFLDFYLAICFLSKRKIVKFCMVAQVTRCSKSALNSVRASYLRSGL